MRSLLLLTYFVCQLQTGDLPAIRAISGSDDDHKETRESSFNDTSNGAIHKHVDVPLYINTSTNQLWYDIGPDTILWHVPHYEDRPFAYGGPSIILMIFHNHNVTMPNVFLLVDNTEYIDTCRWITFGKLARVKFETNYFISCRFQIRSTVSRENSNNCLAN